jgi:hypothetical protein
MNRARVTLGRMLSSVEGMGRRGGGARSRKKRGVLATCVELGLTVWALGKSVLQERAKANPTCQRWVGAG